MQQRYIGNAAKDPNRRKEYLILLDPKDEKGLIDAWKPTGYVER